MTKQERAEHFVRTWQAAPNLAHVLACTGKSKRQAIGLANFYRKRGVPLKCFPRGGYRLLDYAALAALC